VLAEVHRNVLGSPLIPCCVDPLTGYTRTGYCEVPREDSAVHAVCAIMTEDFLEFTRSRGNDLTAPMLEWGFPGLKPGDHWCLCASRWQEAFLEGKAPKVVLAATHEAALGMIRLEDLKQYAAEASEEDV